MSRQYLISILFAILAGITIGCATKMEVPLNRHFFAMTGALLMYVSGILAPRFPKQD